MTPNKWQAYGKVPQTMPLQLWQKEFNYACSLPRSDPAAQPDSGICYRKRTEQEHLQSRILTAQF